MILREAAEFRRELSDHDLQAVAQLADQGLSICKSSPLLYLGYIELPDFVVNKFMVITPSQEVNNFFGLGQEFSKELQPLVMTVGLRSSRFAPILFWEAFHVLKSEGYWLDIDFELSCNGTILSDDDLIERAYYRPFLEEIWKCSNCGYLARLFRKREVPKASGISGWTFGILTSGNSTVAARMSQDILNVAPADVEIIICGPMPLSMPEDLRIRQIDLDSPEPRGWITRKKNMIADAARYENLCIMHDRFLFPANFFFAMQKYGNNFSVLTFPQVYFADHSRTCLQRYPDYQLLAMDNGVRDTFLTKIYDGDRIFHPRYDDFSETAFCCGGVYVTKKYIWNLIRQDESLFHCEWEDILFGLESQRKGIPHRVNPYACFESMVPHPLLLTRINLLDPSGRQERLYLHISGFHQRKAASETSDFLPVLNITRRGYCEKLADRFNSMTMVDGNRRISIDDFRESSRLSEIWQVVSRHAGSLPVNHRDEVFQIICLLSHLVYNYPACILQFWSWEEECRLSGVNDPGHDMITAIKRALDEGGLKRVISLASMRVRRTLGGLLAGEVAPAPSGPFLHIIDYFKEVERYYPVLFQDESSLNDNGLINNGKRWDNIVPPAEESHWKTIFLRHGGEVLPVITTTGRGITS